MPRLPGTLESRVWDRMIYSYEVFMKELGARLRQMRRDRGWTLRTMVVEHGFHLTHWQKFEKGKIALASLLRICQVFDVRVEELVANIGAISEAEEPGQVIAQGALAVIDGTKTSKKGRAYFSDFELPSEFRLIVY